MADNDLNLNISVVIPAYNSELSLAELAQRLRAVLEAIEGKYELILVNDGSTDRSWDIICKMVEEHKWIRGINLMRNYGQHNALLCGIRRAQYDVVVTMDDDLQHPPEEIPKMLDKLVEGYDVVYGRPQKEQHGIWRNIASLATKMVLQGSMGIETARNVSAFRALRTQVRDAFTNYESPFVSIDVLLTWGTKRFTAVPVRHDPRQAGLSSYNFRKLVTHTMNMMTGFSTLPLKLASLVGFASTVFGLGVLIYVVTRYLIEGTSVPGFAFLACIIAMFSGAQLFALGIIGEYLARTHFRTIEKPPYVIRANSEGPSVTDSLGRR